MASVADLVDPVRLEAVATPSDYKLGTEIAAGGGVELEEFGPLRVVARVSGGQRRRVELRPTPEGLAFTCTCSAKLSRPCKHVVAAGLVTWDTSPKRRSG